MNTKNTTAIATTDQNTGYLTETVNLAELFSEELDGLRPSFERIKIPAGGGLAYEVPGDDPNSPDSAKDFSAVILYHHPINSYYKEKFTGGNNPPDCSSLDGKLGVVAETGECKECKTCPYAKFGSGENGGMACKQKRRMYLLREGEMLPIIMTLPTGSLAEFTKYVTRLVTRGMKANHVVTKFSLKRAQNSTGINYSQVICSVDRPLSPEEKKNIASMTEQIKLIAGGQHKDIVLAAFADRDKRLEHPLRLLAEYHSYLVRALCLLTRTGKQLVFELFRLDNAHGVCFVLDLTFFRFIHFIHDPLQAGILLLFCEISAYSVKFRLSTQPSDAIRRHTADRAFARTVALHALFMPSCSAAN